MQIDGSKVEKKSYIQLQISLVTMFQCKVFGTKFVYKISNIGTGQSLSFGWHYLGIEMELLTE